jgi:hypothetical protein
VLIIYVAQSSIFHFQEKNLSRVENFPIILMGFSQKKYAQICKKMCDAYFTPCFQSQGKRGNPEKEKEIQFMHRQLVSLAQK